MLRNILAVAFVLFAACSQACSHSCTEIGCLDQLSGTIKTADGTWSNGTYVITIATDQTSYTCSMKLPDDFPKRGAVSALTCEPALGLWGLSLQQDSECKEESAGGAVNQSCTPTPDHYTLTFPLDGTPDTMTIQVERDGTVLSDEVFDPSYKENQPNGKGCGPVCRQGAVELTLP